MTIEERNTARAIQDIAKEMKKTQKIDWEQRRYEIAKEMLAANYEFFIRMFGGDTNITRAIMDVVLHNADALIAELRKGKE